MKSVFQEDKVQNHLSGRGVEWRFNVEKAPWWGGVFERLIQSMKHCLRKIVERSRLSLDELSTVLIEIEAIINPRQFSGAYTGGFHRFPETPLGAG